MRKIFGFYVFHRAPDAVTHIGVKGFQLADNLLYVVAIALLLERAEFVLLVITGEDGITRKIFLADETEGTNHLHGEFLHLQFGCDSAEISLKNEIEEQGLDDVVFVMPEGNFVAAELLRHLKKCFATIPGAEKTMGFARVFGIIKTGGMVDERYFVVFAKRFEIGSIGLVRNVFDGNMDGAYPKMRDVYL